VIAGNFRGLRGEEQVSRVSLRWSVVTQHRKCMGPWVREEDTVWGGTSLSDRTNQIAVICHLSSPCTDKPNLPKFFSSNWKACWRKSRANAFCRVPPNSLSAALPKQPSRFPALRGHRLASRFEPPALPLKFGFLPLYVIMLALVSYRSPLLAPSPRSWREAGVWFTTGDQSNVDAAELSMYLTLTASTSANVFKKTTFCTCRHEEQ
jgi:hypothetical protein